MISETSTRHISEDIVKVKNFHARRTFLRYRCTIEAELRYTSSSWPTCIPQATEETTGLLRKQSIHRLPRVYTDTLLEACQRRPFRALVARVSLAKEDCSILTGVPSLRVLTCRRLLSCLNHRNLNNPF